MNVLVLEREMSSARGGQERSLLDVCEGLAARGNDLTLAYLTPGDLGERYRRICRRLIHAGAYTVDRSNLLQSGGAFVSSLVALGGAHPDVVYANQYLDSPLAHLVALLLRRPFVCHLRLPPPDEFCFQYRWGMSGAVRLIAPSQHTRQDYIARGFRADRIDVVPNGVTVEGGARRSRDRAALRAALGVAPGTFLVAFAGRLHPIKGLDVLIEAVAQLRGDVVLVLAGGALADGSSRDYAAELRALAESRRLGDRCRFAGRLASVPDLFAAADVTVLPSTGPESFGRVLVESLAVGTPVVASRIGGIPEVLTGEFEDWLVPPGDAAALAARLDAARDWRARDPDLADRCRRHVETRYTADRMAGGVDRVLRQVVEEWRAGVSVPAATAMVR